MKRLLENEFVCLLLEEGTDKIYVQDKDGVHYTGAALSGDEELDSFVMFFLFEAHTSFQKDEMLLEGLFHE